MGSGPSDEELIRRYVLGSAGAFETLVRRHERRVYNVAFRILGREEDARDASQDAFMTALRALPSFRGEAAFTTWIHRVTVNACYDMLRKRKREPLAEVGEPREEPSPVDHADATAVAVDVQRALGFVPEEFRTPLVLHDVQDLPYDEIAEILGVPLGTVKSRIHRGRVALATALWGEQTTAGRPSEETPLS